MSAKKFETNAERQQDYRDRVRRDKGPVAGELATSLRGMHAAIVKASDEGDEWAMNVRGRNPRDTAENIVAYARGERGRSCTDPFAGLKL